MKEERYDLLRDALSYFYTEYGEGDEVRIPRVMEVLKWLADNFFAVIHYSINKNSQMLLGVPEYENFYLQGATIIIHRGSDTEAVDDRSWEMIKDTIVNSGLTHKKGQGGNWHIIIPPSSIGQ